VGYYEKGKLIYAGKVGTGFNEELLRHLSKELSRLEVRGSPFRAGTPPARGVHWVSPKLVAQIGFTEWTPDAKLRHPRFLGLREDKPPGAVVREWER
jgi:bifunctional non-homologous end joining protein LigD